MVFPVIDIVPVAALVIPFSVQTAVVVPLEPILTEFAPLPPISLFEIVKFPQAPDV
jgi:hypothetical protein